MPYYKRTSRDHCGFGIVAATCEAQAIRNTTSVSHVEPATDADMAWYSSMGGQLPEPVEPMRRRPALEVGGTVYVAMYDRRRKADSETMVIRKIGRRWVEIARSMDPHVACRRFNRDTFVLDGGGYTPPGEVWASEAVYNTSAEATMMLFRVFGSGHADPEHVARSIPEDLSPDELLERIKLARRILIHGC